MKHSLLFALLILGPGSAAVAQNPPPPSYRSIAELKAAHDRAMLRDLAVYLDAHPKADDREQGYMTLFDTVIEHDWFADHESAARRYLTENPDGAVRSLAQIVATMARVQAGKYGDALAIFRQLIDGLVEGEQEEFASEFADTLANAAAAAGEFGIARQVYEALLGRFGQREELRAKVNDDLARLDRVGKPAPTVIARDHKGQVFRLADLKGKYVLVDFWATWCAPCLAELPNVRAAYDKYHAKGFEVVSVSLDEEVGPLDDFLKARQLPWVQIHNPTCTADLVELFGVNNIPATFLIDPTGKIIRLELRGPALEKTLAGLIK